LQLSSRVRRHPTAHMNCTPALTVVLCWAGLCASARAEAQTSKGARVCGGLSRRSGGLNRLDRGGDSTDFAGRPGLILGQVVDVTDAPVEHILVMLLRGIRDTVPVRRVITDKLGRFRFDSLPTARSYVLLFTGRLLERQWHEIYLVSAAEEMLCVHLRAPPFGLEPLTVGPSEVHPPGRVKPL
jgi:hypothetical protein